jgi:hypothetical protein
MTGRPGRIREAISAHDAGHQTERGVQARTRLRFANARRRSTTSFVEKCLRFPTAQR